MKWKKLARTIYPCTVYLCQGGTVPEIKAKLKRLGLRPDDEEMQRKSRGKQLGWTLKMTDSKNKFAVLIWVGSAKRTPRDIRTITHECLHATYYVFEYIGLEGGVCHTDQELHAYFLDYLVREVLEFFWQKPRFTVDFGFEP